MPILFIEISAFINYLFNIPKGATELNNTSKIIEHIKMEHLYVCVLFVGSNLNTALDFLQSRKRQFNGSPLIIHYHPSFVTVHHNLSQVCIFVPSNRPWLTFLALTGAQAANVNIVSFYSRELNSSPPPLLSPFSLPQQWAWVFYFLFYLTPLSLIGTKSL